jgi:asparagine synthase (glutamine-hydrolysing)
LGETLWTRIRWLPQWGRRAASMSISGLSAQSWDRVLRRLMPSRLRSVVTDVQRYLPDDLLVKVDRASMSVGLESRAPMLDHRLVEFAWRLPEKLLVRNGQSKWILRQVLDRYVPKELVDRPKAGFGLPVAKWLRDELRDWAEHLLRERAIRSEGFLDPAPVRTMWEEHVSGRHDRSSYLWNVLMFQAWLEGQGRTVSRDASSGAAQPT